MVKGNKGLLDKKRLEEMRFFTLWVQNDKHCQKQDKKTMKDKWCRETSMMLISQGLETFPTR